MNQSQLSNIITTRALSEGELANLFNSIGSYLLSQGMARQSHSMSLLDYRVVVPAKRGIFGKRSRSIEVVVQVTELPVKYSVGGGPQINITAGLAFSIRAPSTLYQTVASFIAPYAATTELLQVNAAKALAGTTFEKRVPGVACDHCGYVQEIAIPCSIERIEGNLGYGPGGAVTVTCSNRACNMSFPVSWDNVIVQIQMTGMQSQQQPARVAPVPHAPPRPATSPSPTPAPRQSFSRPKGKAATWYGYGQGVRVSGYDISGGLLYVGEVLPNMYGNQNDACLINPRLAVSRPGSRAYAEALGYWPQYANMSENCRAIYLRWLAGGRTDATVDLGYAFLFFYGLERRLLVEGPQVPAGERAQIVEEVVRLRHMFKDSRSFQSYSTGLLMAEWVLYRSGESMPDYLSEGDSVGMGPMRVMIARYSASGEPLPADVAIRWLKFRPDCYKLKTPARRCPDEFAALFAFRYKERFDDGVIVKPNRKRLTYSCPVASPSFRLDKPLAIGNLPDPFDVTTGALKKIIGVAEECTEELAPYSRLMGKPESERSPVAVCSNLPAPLAATMPVMDAMKRFLEASCNEGPALISVGSLYEALGECPPAVFGKRECEEVSGLVEACGFGIAPQPRYHNIKIPPDGSVVLFPGGHGAGFEPSREFRIIGTILRLGSLVAQIDEDVSPVEVGILQSLVDDNRGLSAVEKSSLGAFLLWGIRTPQSASGLKKSCSEMSEPEKAAVGHVLVALAVADGHISPREVSQLEKLYTSLGFEKERVAADLHAVAAGSGPVTVGRKEAEPSYAIPAPEAASRSTFVLNEELIRIREIETAQAKAILTEIFTGEEEPAEAADAAADEGTADSLSSLDGPYRELLKRLLVESEWELSALEVVCRDLGLMPDGAMEVLNEWAIANAEAPLIDYGDPVYIDVDLARGIIDVQ